MSKYLIAFGLFCGINNSNLFGQKLPSIQLDRPDQTECPFITPTNYIQLESGFNYEEIDASQSSWSFPSILWKYGLNDKVEFRLITELISSQKNQQTISGISPLTVGFKTALWEERGWLPKTSFIGHITTSDIGSKEFHTKYIAPSFRFTMQHLLSEKLSIGYNLGAEWNGENAEQTYIYTLTAGMSITDKIGCYAELYGYFPKVESNDHRIDGGFTYLLNNDFIIDISGGLGLTKNAPKGYISFGISYRFKAHSNKSR